MVFVAEAVIYERAVMVKKLHTSSTYLAMEIGFSLDHFIIGTEIIEVYSFTQGLVNYSNEVELRLNITWVHTRSTDEKSESE
jgi:hypothetical protein